MSKIPFLRIPRKLPETEKIEVVSMRRKDEHEEMETEVRRDGVEERRERGIDKERERERGTYEKSERKRVVDNVR